MHSALKSMRKRRYLVPKIKIIEKHFLIKVPLMIKINITEEF